MIRVATKEDAHQISILWKDMVMEARPNWNPNAYDWQKMCEDLLCSGIYHIVVFEHNKTIVGFIDGMIFPEPSTGKKHGVAQHFYVVPEHRGTGVSGKLYEEILFVAMQNGATILELFCFPEMEKYWQDRGFETKRLMMRRPINV
jgi:GNAT superfamily N-acetyltransferase